jgi:hypothetical protein
LIVVHIHSLMLERAILFVNSSMSIKLIINWYNLVAVAAFPLA